MDFVATPTDQLTSQTHHLCLSSPVLGTPGNVPERMETTGTLNPSTDAAGGAQPPETMSPAGLPFVAALPTSSDDRCGVRIAARCREPSLDRGFASDWVYTRSVSLEELPNEVLFHILGFLDVSDLLSASRTSHLFRSISCSPILHHYRLQHARSTLPPLLWSSSRPSLADLIARRVFLTNNSVVSRRLARSLVSIRLARRLAVRPSAETLVERSVLPKECVPGMSTVYVAPGLVAKKKAIERERVKDGLRRWVAAKWRGEVREREEGVRRWEESRGIGRVWRLRKFWERVSRGEEQAANLALR